MNKPISHDYRRLVYSKNQLRNVDPALIEYCRHVQNKGIDLYGEHYIDDKEDETSFVLGYN